jgi:carnitine 3-dehydrogenase / betainyl-CoA thioesterase
VPLTDGAVAQILTTPLHSGTVHIVHCSVPFARYETVVGQDWIDYNGHLNDAGYAILLTEANEVLLASLGLSADYRAETGRALYTVECHIRYLAECRLGDLLAAVSILVGADAKRLRVHTTLSRGDGTAVATGEHLYLHVDDEAGKVTAMPPDRWAAVEALLTAHAGLERPAHLGKGIAIPEPKRNLSE